jgi:hypothetical protein
MFPCLLFFVNTSAPLNYKVLLYGLKRICKAANVTVVTPHELRHSSTELYMQLGEANEEDIHRTNERLQWVAQNLSDTISGKSKGGFHLRVVDTNGHLTPRKAFLKFRTCAKY